MSLKFVVFLICLAYVNAGFINTPAVAYSSAPAVSNAYFHQATPAVVAQAAPAVAVAHAAPTVAVAHAAPVAIHAPAYGQSHQSVVRGLGGAQAVSTYSKAVDSAFSSVRKYDTRITNDALSVAHAPVGLTTYAHATPVVSTLAAHPAPVVSTYAAHATPVVSTYAAHAAPLTLSHAPVAAAPVVKSAISYSPAAVVSHASFTGLGASYAW